MSRIVLEVQKFIEGLAKAGTRPGEHVRQIGETRDAPFERRFIANVQDHSRRDGSCGILPVALLRAVLTGTDDHVGDILGVAHVTWREETHLAQRIESRARLLLNRRKLEAEMALTAAKPRRLRPILTFDVIDHRALSPSQERRNHQAHAFAAPRWRERKNMLWPVVAEIAQAISAFPAPPTDVHAVLCGE